ncbi:MAG: 50S ribosomal protein L21 [Alphaproteobacteria bacterium]|nr:50S ribosomal protein L21 [Alphaproteobacteria bacterium]
MFAVVKTGGKQYRVAKDDVIRVEKLSAEPGDKVALNDVLLIDDAGKQVVGAPTIDGAAVEAEVIDQTRADKIIVFKKKRRQNYRRTKGHRQHQTVLKITDILASGAKPAAASEAAPELVAEPEPAKTEAKKATAKKASAKKAAAKKAGAKKSTAKKAAAKKDDGGDA